MCEIKNLRLSKRRGNCHRTGQFQLDASAGRGKGGKGLDSSVRVLDAALIDEGGLAARLMRRTATQGIGCP